jgi:hypothetical protein
VAAHPLHEENSMTATPRTLARIAGLLYLLLAVLGTWAQLFVRAEVHVPGDAGATAVNIAEHEALFRLGLGADILMATVFVLLGLVLHRLTRHIHAGAATALLVFVAVGAGSILLNLTFHVGALLVATEPAYLNGGDTLALLLLDLHTHGYVLSGVFFGLWLLPMGYLAWLSPLFPRWLGAVIVVGSVAWVADPVLAYTLPDAPDMLRQIVSAPTWIAEFGLMLYLLIRGVRTVPAAPERVGSAQSSGQHP